MVVTQEDLDLILDYQVREVSRLLVTNYYLCIDIQNNILIVNVPESCDMQEVEAQEEAIGIAAYLKLGCKKVSFYCCQSWLWDYNADIRIDELNNMTAAVLSSPTETYEEQPQTQQQPPQSQVAIDWISFEGIANSLGTSQQTVNDEVESFGIFVTLYRGNLGLSGENLENYLNRRHTQMVEKFRSMLAKNISTPSAQPSRAAAKLKAVPSTSNGATPTEGGLSLPPGFNMMDGRKRRPDIPTALKIAIAALPDANDEETRKMYVRQIATRENVENFVMPLAAQFEGSAKFRSVSATAKDIYNAARKFWDEYLDSTPA